MDKVQNITSPTLFTLSGSPFARFAEMVVYYKKLDIEVVVLEFSSGVLKSDEYKALNPRGKVPTLVDFQNGKKIVVYESVAVAQYLDMQYPDIPLQSTDPELRAMALTKLADSNNLINAGVFLPMQLFRETDETRNMDLIVKGMKGMLSELEYWESSMPSDSTYLVGNDLTIVDLNVFSILGLYDRLGFGPFLSSMFPKLAKFFKAVSELDCAVKSYPKNWAASPPSEKFAAIVAEAVEKAKST